ncbi:MAG: Hsp70 family protein [Methanolinea sp.]|nr:Hsp70 family protein [Methanolinea sp.]
MPFRMAVDFGTSNTVLASWDEEQGSARVLEIPGWSRPCTGEQGSTPVIPSLIHYEEGGARWIGQQVHERDLLDSPATIRWMKHYISTRSPVRVPLPGGPKSYREAGADFLQAVLSSILHSRGTRDAEAIFTVPVEAFEHYQDWVISLSGNAGIDRVRVVDEATAAALASGLTLQPGEVFMLFDMGGGTLDVAVVRLEESEEGSGRRCRVLGKAGEDLGGMRMDQWIFGEVQERGTPTTGPHGMKACSRQLLSACERAKEALSLVEETEITIQSGTTGECAFSTPFTRDEFERLLDTRDVFFRLNATLQRALQGAYSRGFAEDDLSGVVMVGGCSQIPAIRRALEHRFGRSRVWYDHPLDTVARGAAAFAAGIDLDDHVQHDYALRFWNSRSGEYEYRTLVRQGDPYPSPRPVGRFLVRATYDGQAQMGVPIFEMGRSGLRNRAALRELVSEPGGGVRLVDLPEEELEKKNLFWMNENAPVFIPANPPAMRDESRFEFSFSLDGNKRLLITARDTRSGQVVMKDQPVVRLV